MGACVKTRTHPSESGGKNNDSIEKTDNLRFFECPPGSGPGQAWVHQGSPVKAGQVRARPDSEIAECPYVLIQNCKNAVRD